MQKLQSDCVNLNNYFFLFRRGNIVLPPKRVYMYMPFPYCLLFGDIKKLIIKQLQCHSFVRKYGFELFHRKLNTV